jgi:hypothetical protein
MADGLKSREMVTSWRGSAVAAAIRLFFAEARSLAVADFYTGLSVGRLGGVCGLSNSEP